jgi:hypothetical protein
LGRPAGFRAGRIHRFGVPPEESASRFRETVEIVLRAGPTAAQFSASISASRPRDFAEAGALPHPPVWMAASSEGRSMGRRAGVLDPDGPAFLGAVIGRKRRSHSEKLAVAGPRGRPRHPDRAAGGAADNAGEAANAQRRRGFSILSRRTASAGHAGIIYARWHRSVQRYLDEVILHGTPDRSATKSCGYARRSARPSAVRACHQSFMLLTERYCRIA